jgi:hypothetical protein
MSRKPGSRIFLILLLIPAIGLMKRFSANKDSVNSLGMFAVVIAFAVAILSLVIAEWWGWLRDPLRKCSICKKLLNGDYEIERTSPRDAKVTRKKCGNTYNVRR